MEATKLSFTTNNVNELIGSVPKRILRYCFGILLLTVVAVGLMISITPYPKNLVAKASILEEKDVQGMTDNFVDGKHKSLICKIQLGKSSFNEHYLKNAQKVLITVTAASGRYRLTGTILSLSKSKDGMIAEAILLNNANLQELLKIEDKLLKRPLQVELTNDKFSIKDKLESTLSVN